MTASNSHTSPAHAAPVAAMEAPAERELVTRAQKGDRGAFDLLVRRHQRALYYFLLRRVRTQADAYDLTQRTFVKAYTKLSGFRAKASFRTWVFRIAINLSLNHLRDAKRHQQEPLDEQPDTHASARTGLLAAEQSRVLRAAVAELPEKQRAVVEHRIYDDLTFREIAELLHCTANTAKVNFHHALQKLRKRLGNHR